MYYRRRRYKRTPPWLFFLFAIGGGLLALHFFITTVQFLRIAKKATGHVSDISSYHSTCSSGGKHKRTYSCVKYNAAVTFTTDDFENHIMTIGAGSHKTSCNSCRADKKVGDAVELLYNPNDPNEARQSGFMSVWGGVFISIIFSAIGVLGGVFSGAFHTQW